MLHWESKKKGRCDNNFMLFIKRNKCDFDELR